MKPRLDYDKASPGIMEAVLALESAVRTSGLDPF